ncbi:hypothetical protein ABPG77_004249 [Micractinium sp. CCAP 211/92]
MNLLAQGGYAVGDASLGWRHICLQAERLMRVLGRTCDTRNNLLSVSAGAAAVYSGSGTAPEAAASLAPAPAAAEQAGASKTHHERQQHLAKEMQQGRQQPQPCSHVAGLQGKVQTEQQVQQQASARLEPKAQDAEAEQAAEGRPAAGGSAGWLSPACALCQLGKEAEGALGKLLPFDCSTKKGGERWEHVHLLCAAWSPRAHWAGPEQPGSQHGLLMVPEEVRRGYSLKCSCCRRRGAAMGCDLSSCRRTYHLPCAMLEKHSRFASDSWQLYCPEHAGRAEPDAEADDMREQRAALSRLLRLRDGQGTLSPGGKAILQAAVAAKARRKAARQKQRQLRQQQPQTGTRPDGGAAATPPRPEKRLRANPTQAQPPGQHGTAAAAADAAAVAAAAAGPVGPPSADPEGGHSQQRHEQRARCKLEPPQQQQQPREQQAQEGAPCQRSPGSSQPADTSPQLGQVLPAGNPSHEVAPAAAEHAGPAGGDDGKHQERPARVPEAGLRVWHAVKEEPGEEQGRPERQQPMLHGERAEQPVAEQAVEAEGQAQAGALELLPAAVRALLHDVFGTVSPDIIPGAADYLYSEGVRSFSDVGFVDPADFYANVPTTKMLLNKMFVMHRLRDAAHAGAE